MAAVDYFLRIDGIQGESTDAKHKGAIDVESFAWTEVVIGAASGGAGAGGGTNPVDLQGLHVAMNTSKASPLLMAACLAGKHFKEAVLTVRKAGKGQLDFLTFTLGDVLVTVYEIAGHVGTLPADQVTLRFARIQFAYRAEKPDGSLDSAVTVGWDVKAKKPI